ncbi:hypothetical protein AAIA72_16420 [Hahella sp. SMD15-11]|uniref:CheW-like domain-containing protein n=1 Tax=Thermohahella caldifontis TaxID=3142973 RepID=A0AB39UW33_9GAMM
MWTGSLKHTRGWYGYDLPAGRFCTPAEDVYYLGDRSQLEVVEGIACLNLPGWVCPVYHYGERLQPRSGCGEHRQILVLQSRSGQREGTMLVALACDHVIKFRTARDPVRVPACMGRGPVGGVLMQQGNPVWLLSADRLIHHIEQVARHVDDDRSARRLAG